MKVFWTEQSENQLKRIFDYIAADSQYYAKLTISEIISQAEKAAKSPLAGRMVPEIYRDDVREVFHHPYRIIYLHVPTKNRIEILGVLHEARNFKGFTPKDK